MENTYAISIHLGAGLLSCNLDSPQSNTKRQNIVQHVKRVSHQCERVYRIADEEFDEEEETVDSQQDLYPAALGERHGKGSVGDQNNGEEMVGVW